MKTRILSALFAILAAGLLASSCDKVDLLEGTSWVYTADSGEGFMIVFSSKENCALKLISTDDVVTSLSYGEYRGKGKVIAIDWKENSWKMTGTINDDVMTICWNTNSPNNTFKFRKKK